MLYVRPKIELNSPSNQFGWFSLLLSINLSSPRGSNIAADIDDTQITAYCAVCGYQLKDWRVTLGGNRSPEILHPRLRKAFR
jgi:hypothetical protein